MPVQLGYRDKQALGVKKVRDEVKSILGPRRVVPQVDVPRGDVLYLPGRVPPVVQGMFDQAADVPWEHSGPVYDPTHVEVMGIYGDEPTGFQIGHHRGTGPLDFCHLDHDVGTVCCPTTTTPFVLS